MAFAGHVENGMIVLDDPVALPEGAHVQVQVVQPPVADQAGGSLFDVLQPVIGKAADLPADASQNVDHYLYGHPKK